MEPKYDSNAAKNLLSGFIEKHLELEKKNFNDHLSLFKSDKYRVQGFGNPANYKLISPTKNSRELEEATFTVHGIILAKEFPPVGHDRYFNGDQNQKRNLAAFIRQYVAVTGLDLDSFNKTLEGLARVHRCFRDVLPIDELEDFQPLSIDGTAAMACHTRYFTSRRSCQSAVPQSFGLGIDPDGTLESLKGQTFIHTEDNVVQYLGTKTTGGESSFQKGDIVEITATFLCVPIRSRKHKMITSLKSIVLLDDKIREKARDEQAEELLNVNTWMTGPKRRRIITDGDEGLLSIKCARMDLS